MPLIAVEGCTISCSASPFQITSKASTGVKIDGKGVKIDGKGVKIDGKGVYREKLSVLVPTGASQGGGTLIDSVTIDIEPHIIVGTKVDGKTPIAVGDTATKTGKFQIGQSSSSLPIVVTVSDAGQSAVNVTKVTFHTN